MASLPREIDDRPTISATIPHFLKIILEDTIRDSKLKIPKMFVRKYGKHLSNPVYLKLPSGSEWQVELKKSDNEAWLDKGWTEFSEFYSLDCGDLLVFGYEGDSKFQVCIFNRSTTEIDYPITSNHCDQPADSNGEPTMPQMPQMEATEDDISVEILEEISPCAKTEKIPLDDDSVEILDEFSSCPNTREKSPLYPSIEILEDFPPSPQTRENSSLYDASVEILEDFRTCPKSRQKYPLPCPHPHKKKRTRSSSKGASKINLQDGIPHFESKMEITVLANIGTSEDDFYAKEDGGDSTSTQRFLKRTPKVLGRMHPLTTTEKAIALERAIAFQSENPYFKVAMQPSYIQQSYLSVPSKFFKRHLIKQPANNIILRVSNGRTWSVKFKYGDSQALFQYGWLAFVRDNDLRVGDVCVFMLINKIKLLFKVVFFRTTEDANCPLSPGHGRGAIDQVEKRRSPIDKIESDRTMNCKIGTTTHAECPDEYSGDVKVEIGKYKLWKFGGLVTEKGLHH